MAIEFGNEKGEAQKAVQWYKMKDGENKVRFFGQILPRYVYWKNNTNNKYVSVECLSFDRDKEMFTNTEKDWFREYFNTKDAKGKFEDQCSWAYSINCYDPTDKSIKVFGLKKKLYEQIVRTAKKLGNPTSLKEGWWIVFNKVSTGPNTYNVEYTLDQLECTKEAVSEDVLAAIAEAKNIEEYIPRPTADEVHDSVKSNYLSGKDAPNPTPKSFGSTPAPKKEANNMSSDFDDDIPF